MSDIQQRMMPWESYGSGVEIYIGGDGDAETDAVRLVICNGNVEISQELRPIEVVLLSRMLADAFEEICQSVDVCCPACGAKVDQAGPAHSGCRLFPFFPGDRDEVQHNTPQ